MKKLEYSLKGKNVEVRGKNIVTGEWVYGDLITGTEDRFFIHKKAQSTSSYTSGESRLELVEVDPETISEDFDVVDCEDHQLYEGDIVIFGDDFKDAFAQNGDESREDVESRFRGLLLMDHGHLMYMNVNENGSTSMDEIDQSTIKAYGIKKIGNLWDTPNAWRR